MRKYEKYSIIQNIHKINMDLPQTIGLFVFVAYLWNIVLITEKVKDICELLCSTKISQFDEESYISKIIQFYEIARYN